MHTALDARNNELGPVYQLAKGSAHQIFLHMTSPCQYALEWPTSVAHEMLYQYSYAMWFTKDIFGRLLCVNILPLCVKHQRSYYILCVK
jgi:hypothetical protein